VTGPPLGDQRRGTLEKVLPVLDVLYALIGAVLAVFGRRKLDRIE
jgi:hypothetical protein